MKSDNRLGKGLSALLGPMEKDINFRYISIENIERNPKQPRKDFDSDKLNELAASIKEHGILQPIIVEANKDGKYIIIAGERRYRASKIAGIDQVPVIINEGEKKFEMAMIENLQRQDLNIVEEIQGYCYLIEKYQYTQEALAKILGKSRSHIANMLRLNNLPEEIKKQLALGKISMGHARALLTEKNPIKAMQDIISKKLTVRQVEKIVKSDEGNEDIKILEKKLEDKYGIQVQLKQNNKSSKIEVYFNDLNMLDRILSKLL